MDNHRQIIHVDMDAFYASVEILDNPELKGKSVIVGASPEKQGVGKTGTVTVFSVPYIAIYTSRNIYRRTNSPART
ncbi:MAG: hypothetical protein KAT11_01165 [Phycisphaerae bacterium]|nr:hypothetical protein [Phycisphaerae bacterium]